MIAILKGVHHTKSVQHSNSYLVAIAAFYLVSKRFSPTAANRITPRAALTDTKTNAEVSTNSSSQPTVGYQGMSFTIKGPRRFVRKSGSFCHTRVAQKYFLLCGL